MHNQSFVLTVRMRPAGQPRVLTVQSDTSATANPKVPGSFHLLDQHEGAEIMSWWEDAEGLEQTGNDQSPGFQSSPSNNGPGSTHIFKAAEAFERTRPNYGRTSFFIVNVTLTLGRGEQRAPLDITMARGPPKLQLTR